MTPSELQNLVQENMQSEAVNASGNGGKFEIEISSEQFAGLNTLKRHQLVYKIVNPYISSGEIHALTIRAYTPREFNQV